MFSVLIGIALVILAVVLWLGGVTVPHALAILIGLVGILVLLYGFGDRVKYTRL
jgi:hypothetical protein